MTLVNSELSPFKTTLCECSLLRSFTGNFIVASPCTFSSHSSPIHSTSALARNERDLIGRRHFVDTRVAANYYGDRFVGALKICEVVLHIYKHDYVKTSKNPIFTLDFVYTSHMHNKKSLYSSVFDSDYIVVGDYQNGILSPYSCFTKIINICGVTKQFASKKVRYF